jgi:hypothetical protein
LIWRNAIASKDNMSKRGWIGDTKFIFVTRKNMLFLCPAAKYMWSVVSSLVGAQTRPGNFTQCFYWIEKFAKGLTNIHVVGLAAL